MRPLLHVIACIAACQLGGCLNRPVGPSAVLVDPARGATIGERTVRVPTTLTSGGAGAPAQTVLILGVQ